MTAPHSWGEGGVSRFPLSLLTRSSLRFTQDSLNLIPIETPPNYLSNQHPQLKTLAIPLVSGDACASNAGCPSSPTLSATLSVLLHVSDH